MPYSHSVHMKPGANVPVGFLISDLTTTVGISDGDDGDDVINDDDDGEASSFSARLDEC